nr:DUF2950 domain-containing protein [Dechloromonas sp.]
MKFNKTLQSLALALALAGAPLAHAGKGLAPQQVFAAPEEAARALADALRNHDHPAILAVVGAGAGRWLFSGDPVADRAEGEKFLAAYDRQHAVKPLADDRAQLLVGDDDWPFPAPLVRKGNGWVFDTAAGKEEITNRRIGRNELDTIQTLLAIVDAQREYAASDPDGNGLPDYARRFQAQEGKRDGLYWPTAGGEKPSPLGPLIAQATREGYSKADAGYHGYRYRILTGQGPAAPGGKYDYLVGDKLLGGFAILAYPVKYGVSGIMSFMVSHDGTVYEKSLGKQTATKAERITRFDPDASWRKSP